jgi:mono/diheme cytochrome c family protein
MPLTRARPELRRRGVHALLAGAVLLAASASAEDAAGLKGRGERLFREQGCYGCHTVGAFGTPIAPDLARIGAKRDLPYLTKWLRDPAAQRPTAHMPKIALSEAEASALAAYLASLR